MRLSVFARPDLEASVRRLALENDQTNVFNVSVKHHRGALHMTYRALSKGQSKFRSFYTKQKVGSPEDLETPLDLTALGAESGVAPIADPKLFTVGEELYFTFNTGYKADSPNTVGVCRLSPSIGVIQRCDIDGPRQTVEKNWAFFSTSDGDIGGIYGLAPLTLLSLVEGELGSNDRLLFRPRRVPSTGETALKAWSIGTQPLEDAGRLLLIAHEKLAIGPRRTYFGRLIELTDLEGAARARVSRRRLIHSVSSMLPRKGVHNPNLLSATYFAGLDRVDDSLLLSYGINDIDFGLAQMKESSLW